jgi:hypothetical protein
MNWLSKLLGYHDREYHGRDFSVRIEPIRREVVAVFHTHYGTKLRLGGERIGKRWEGIQVGIPGELEAAQVSQIVSDLELAFRAMDYGYVIVRRKGVDEVPETEREAAIAELGEMGYDIEVSADRRRITQKRKEGAPRDDIETIRKQSPRMVYLLQSVHGTRRPFEILAKSKEFIDVDS